MECLDSKCKSYRGAVHAVAPKRACLPPFTPPSAGSPSEQSIALVPWPRARHNRNRQMIVGKPSSSAFANGDLLLVCGSNILSNEQVNVLSVRKRGMLWQAGRGEGTHFVACLSRLTVDHASLSRRGTVPTPTRDLQYLGADYVFFINYIETFCLFYPLPVSPSSATIYLLG